MAGAQDLYLQLKISEFCERCCVWKISHRHLRSPLNKSTGVPQRSRCMRAPDAALERGSHASGVARHTDRHTPKTPNTEAIYRAGRYL